MTRHTTTSLSGRTRRPRLERTTAVAPALAVAVALALALALAAAGAASLGGCASSKEQARARHAVAPWRPPGGTLADSTQAVSAIQAIYRLDDLRGARCDVRRFVDTDVVETRSGAPPAAGAHWFERWTMDRCGTRVKFLVEFSPDPGGGTGVTARFE